MTKPKGREVPNNADSKTKIVFAAFVARDEKGMLSLFYSDNILQQAFSWNAKEVGQSDFTMHANIDIRAPRFLYVEKKQHIPMVGFPDGIYLPSGRFVTLKQERRAEAFVGGVRLDTDEGRKL